MLKKLKEAMAAAHKLGLWDFVEEHCRDTRSINDVVDGRSPGRARRRRLARAAGIALTPRGEALFARDVAKLAEIRARDTRTAAERAEDEAASAAYDAEIERREGRSPRHRPFSG